MDIIDTNHCCRLSESQVRTSKPTPTPIPKQIPSPIPTPTLTPELNQDSSPSSLSMLSVPQYIVFVKTTGFPEKLPAMYTSIFGLINCCPAMSFPFKNAASATTPDSQFMLHFFLEELIEMTTFSKSSQGDKRRKKSKFKYTTQKQRQQRNECMKGGGEFYHQNQYNRAQIAKTVKRKE
ncbi:hypothetical protein SDJN02_01487, partial [Cucurbita argyrosperma subsp. argyrosperma]